MTQNNCTGCSKAVTSPPCASFAARWGILVPPDYHAATPDKVRPSLSAVTRWKPRPGKKGIGIHGPPGAGKTNVLALLVLNLHTPFRWVTGGKLRTMHNDSTCLEGDEQLSARRKMHRMKVTPILVIDDILEVKFTDVWRTALFELLEYRNSQNLLTFWTAQHGEGQIGARIGDTTGEAIERRLCQHHDLFQA